MEETIVDVLNLGLPAMYYFALVIAFVVVGGLSFFVGMRAAPKRYAFFGSVLFGIAIGFLLLLIPPFANLVHDIFVKLA